jgi:hypothetical protein
MTQINIPVNPAIPDAYIEIIPPSVALVQGVPTNMVAVVGTATWGPVNSPTPLSQNNYAFNFGAIQPRTYDMGTQITCASLAGATNFMGVRVTDGTDVAATAILGLKTATSAVVVGGSGYTTSSVVTLSNGAVINVTAVTSGAITAFTEASPPTSSVTGTGAVTAVSATGGGTGATFTYTYANGATIASKYTGSGANGDTVAISTGSAASTNKVTVTRSGRTPEVFDNIPGTGATFWANLVAAINNGQTGLRGASGMIVATLGASTASPVASSVTLAGGVDGVTTITSAVLVGQDTGTRTGMYALRGTGPGLLVLADCADYTTLPAQTSFCLSEGFYGIGVGPSGEYTNLVTVAANKAAAGIDTYAMKVLVGDFAYFLDVANGGAARMVSPQGFAAGQEASLLPFQSGLNKPIAGIVGTQKSYAKQVYAEADLQVIGQAGLDIIANPNPGGNYFGLRFGKNASSSAAINGDNYSRMIPYLAYSLKTVTGQFVGEVITADQAADAVACVTTFLAGLANANPPWISNPQGTQPFSVAIDLSRASGGYEIMNVNVQLGPIVFLFVLNLQAGQTVSIAAVPNL